MFDYENNEDKIWPVYSDCESVRMISTKFETEYDWDYVTIDDSEYTGTGRLDIILPTNFTVEFYSDDSGTDEGFTLHWNCTET